jgi:hypothetical protein
MLQAEAGTEVAESSWCPTPAHTPSRGQADIQTHCNLMIDVLKYLSPTLIRPEHMYFMFLPLNLLSFWDSAKRIFLRWYAQSESIIIKTHSKTIVLQ